MQLLLLLLFPHLYPTKMCAQAIVHDKRETVLSLLPCKNNNYSSRYQACYLNRAGAHDKCLDLFKANCDLQKHTWAQKNENRHDFFNLLATKNGNVKIVQLYLVNAEMKNWFARKARQMQWHKQACAPLLRHSLFFSFSRLHNPKKVPR